MKRMIALLALGLGLSAPAAAADFDVDAGHSSVIFAAHHFGAAWVYGRFNDVSGTFSWDADPSNISMSVTVKAESIDTNNEKRDKHLRSPDYFEVESHPELTFTSTKVVKSGDTYNVTGNLTFHGVTKEITVPMTHTGEGADPWGGYRLGVHGEMTVRMSEHGIQNDGIGDEVKFIVSLEGKRK